MVSGLYKFYLLSYFSDDRAENVYESVRIKEESQYKSTENLLYSSAGSRGEPLYSEPYEFILKPPAAKSVQEENHESENPLYESATITDSEVNESY